VEGVPCRGGTEKPRWNRNNPAGQGCGENDKRCRNSSTGVFALSQTRKAVIRAFGTKQNDPSNRPTGDALDGGGCLGQLRKRRRPKAPPSLGRKRPRKQTVRLASRCCSAKRRRTGVGAQVKCRGAASIGAGQAGYWRVAAGPRAEFSEESVRTPPQERGASFVPAGATCAAVPSMF
jgi:hypothetical protein